MPLKQEFHYKLNRESITEIVRTMKHCMDKQKVEKKNRMSLSLAMESILLDIEEHFGDSKDVILIQQRRIGCYSFRIVYEGEEFNPVDNHGIGEFTGTILTHLGLFPSYSRSDGKNVVTLDIPVSVKKDERNLLLSFAGAIILGLIRPLIPEGLLSALNEYVFGTFSTIFLSLIGIFAGIMILCSILTGICGIGDMTDLSKKGKYMISTTIIKSVIITGLITVVFIPMFSLKFGETGSLGALREIVDLLLKVIPSDPISPFVEGNTLEIAFIAVLVGSFLIKTGGKTKGLKEVVAQANTLLLDTLSGICRLLPLYILSALTTLFWNHGFEVLSQVWKPLVLAFVGCIILALGSLFRVSIKYKVGVATLFKKVFPSFIIGLTTASSMVAFRTVLEVNEKELGIDPSYSRFATPIKNLLITEDMSLAYIGVLYYLAEFNGVPVDIIWFVRIGILLSIIEMAVPPVSGGTLICIGLLLSEFGIPADCLGIAATLVIVADFFLTAGKIVTFHMDMILDADHLGVLNKEVLQGAVKSSKN